MPYFLAKRTVVFVLVAATGAKAQFTAAAGSPFAVGSSPRSVTAADFNGDGKPDIVTSNSGANNVTVLLGNGSRGFTAASGSPFVVGTNPQSVASGDFNGDGRADIVTANSGDNTVTVLLGDGYGGFTPALGSPFRVGAAPFSVALGDFNEDGKADIVTANSGDNTITVLLGDGTGRFTASAASTFAVGSVPRSMAVGDFNRDGKADIVTTNSGDSTVTVLLGDGTGGFTRSSFPVGSEPCSVAVGDFNGDGSADIVTANSGDNTVTVLLGDGSGGFTPAAGSPFPVGSKPCSLAAKDLNGDGDADIVTANSADNTVTVLLGDGTGGFTAAPGSPFAAGTTPSSTVVVDFNGDGKPDLVNTNSGDSTVTVLLNTLPAINANPHSLTFYAGAGQALPDAIPVNLSSSAPGYSNATGGVTTVHFPANASSLSAGVYSGTVRYTAPNFFAAATVVTLIVTNPSGTLHAAAGSPFAVGTSPDSIAVADFNGDGNPDLVTANHADNDVTVLLGDGAGGFTAAHGSPFAVGSGPASVAVGDFNGDGNPDIVTTNSGDNTVTVLLGDGSGGFAASVASPFAVGVNPQSVAVSDVNGDGKLDLVTANTGGNAVTILIGDGAGGFRAAAGSPFAVGVNPVSVAAADFNGDGKPDIVTASFVNNNVTVLLGDGAGGFTAAAGSPFAVGINPQAVAVGDVNGDGKPDIVAANSGGTNLTVLLGNGSGGFAAASGSPFAAGKNPRSVVLVDVNGDGKPDLVTANIGDNTATVLLGNGLGHFTAAAGSPFAAGVFPYFVAAGDFNGDGRQDIVIADIGGGAVTVLLGMPATTSSVLSTTASSTIAYGTSVPLTLTVTEPSGSFNPPTGTAAFLDGGSAIGTATQTGSPYLFAATNLAAGTHTLTGSYSGDSASSPSNSNTVSLTVMPTSQTIAFGPLAKQALGGAPFVIAATASSGLAVIFTSTTSPVCTVSGATITLAITGTCAIQADQPGNANYSAAPPVSQHFTVTLANQTITFGALSNQALGTAPFAVSATASSSLAVSFTSTTLPVCTVSGAIVTLVIMGTCTIQATQAGNASYAAALPVSQHFTVTPAAQTITFGALSNQTLGTAPFTVSATASSGLAVVFTSTTPAVCTVSGTTVKLLTASACTIQAAQAGNSSYAAAPSVSQTFTVMPGSQIITFGVLSSKAFGSPPFTVSATASSGLAVSFTSTTSSVCAVASVTVTIVSAGTCTIEAAQAGNANFSAATPVDQNVTVMQGVQTITFGALPTKAFGAAPFALAAAASSTLAVSFVSSTATVCTVSGAMVTLITAGSCTIQANQPGNTNYAAASPVDQSFTVTTGSQTITFAALSNQVLGSAPFAVNATASSGLAVSFTSTTSVVCTVSAGTVTLLSIGACTIQATQPGDTNYNAAPLVNQKFTVTPSSQTIAFGALSNQTLGIAPFTVGATASSGLAVSFKSTTSPVCTVSGATITLVSVGVCTIEASQPGNTTYAAAAPVDQTFTVAAGSLTLGSVLSAGSYSAVPLAADGIAVAFGTSFSTATAQAGSFKLPLTLAGTVLSIADSNGVTQQAALYYVSPTQVNFVVPEGLAVGSATVTATNSAGSTSSFAATIAPVSPSLITADSTGTGVPAAIALAYASAVGTPKVLSVFNCTRPPLVCATVPIDLGPPLTRVYLALFGTGIRGRTGLSGVSVTLGGMPMQVTYAGAQGTYTGLDQVNVLMDHSLIGAGQITLDLTVDGVPANPVVVSIK